MSPLPSRYYKGFHNPLGYSEPRTCLQQNRLGLKLLVDGSPQCPLEAAQTLTRSCSVSSSSLLSKLHTKLKPYVYRVGCFQVLWPYEGHLAFEYPRENGSNSQPTVEGNLGFPARLLGNLFPTPSYLFLLN